MKWTSSKFPIPAWLIIAKINAEMELPQEIKNKIMNDKLSKKELDKLVDEHFKIGNEAGDMAIMSNVLKFATVTVPKYIQTLYSKGYKAGYAEAKEAKLVKIIKSN